MEKAIKILEAAGVKVDYYVRRGSYDEVKVRVRLLSNEWGDVDPFFELEVSEVYPDVSGLIREFIALGLTEVQAVKLAADLLEETWSDYEEYAKATYLDESHWEESQESEEFRIFYEECVEPLFDRYYELSEED